ncbi:tripartite tricarboxylate transporter TctB family protein [Fusobacterium necrophorum]|uniref:DUF1468 domain-containing protein n=4 Tax=Fusobacterium necrophorum TaxID=859 RepID=A0A017H5W4_9FUSO|nr:tripartite tricarboxylate transporter TctB family protein [Fusobacterium necrophorum]EYD69685.1 hypothetical protein FNF_03861 [Fusobacterium necrophorum subsp. funduliforme B35]KDE62083.1 hypothetical protein FUSO3_08965 [Fusobacterium necrophorum BL]KDE62281.1 hypothetical protein FUSO5_09950 [Fusobacterium necrophorum BFTR-1]KDE64634.1 hypothetical protein FUSO4_07670 [Fusobacterium necrophorum DJ-1]KDE70612.1 hypothetical protein FUSO6_03530 [Fusobacterium necrophorum DAB]
MLEKIFLGFLCVISTFLFFVASKFEVLEMDNYSLGTAFFPKLICVILFIIAFILLILSMKNKNVAENKNIKYPVITILYFGIYILFIERIGYLVSTIIFMISVIFLLKSKSFFINVAFSIIFSGMIYLMFSKGFHISLAEGIFI